MPKQASMIVLSEPEQDGLLQITKHHRSEQQVVVRARIVLAAAQGSSNIRIARELGINVDTVRLWRDRWASWREIEQEKSDQVALTEEERRTLESFVHRGKANARTLTRARILLKSAEGWSTAALAAAFDISEATVTDVRERCAHGATRGCSARQSAAATPPLGQTGRRISSAYR
jgi:transposase